MKVGVSHRPVVVEVTEFVGEPLHVVRLEATRVKDDVEMSWSNCPLTNTLTCQEEVIPEHTQRERENNTIKTSSSKSLESTFTQPHKPDRQTNQLVSTKDLTTNRQHVRL